MGHGLSCGRDGGEEHGLFRAVEHGDLDALLAADPELARRATTIYGRLSLLHVAAANGQLQVLSMLLDDDGAGAGGAHAPDVDVLNRKKQTPLMLAAMHGRTDCVLRLLQAGANQILMFDSVHGRTCLHHAAYYGHADCLQAILSAAKTAPVADSWGFARFVNVRDEHGATPLHLAARQGRPQCVHHLLHAGAIVSAPTASYGFPGSTALHLAARRGNLDCVRELLAWGADRAHPQGLGGEDRLRAGPQAQPPSVRRPAEPGGGGAHGVAFPAQVHQRAQPGGQGPPGGGSDGSQQGAGEADHCQPKHQGRHNHNHNLLLLLVTLMTMTTAPQPPAAAAALTSCAASAWSMEVQDCGHQMCAACTLALCCHSKPNPTTLQALQPPACPFCRATITRLLVANNNKTSSDEAGGRSHGSSSFRGLTSAIRSRIGRGSGRVADSDGICHGQASTPCAAVCQQLITRTSNNPVIL